MMSMLREVYRTLLTSVVNGHKTVHKPPPQENATVASQQNDDRDISLIGVRFVAIILVIFIHVSGKGFASMDHHWWAINVYDSFSRISVPLFFMVTGSLLLPRRQTVSSVLVRCWRITLPLFAWSFLYLLWFKYTGTNYDGWIVRILKSPVVPHLWYLYTLIGAYLFMPVMAGFFQLNDFKPQLVTLVSWFIGASIIPTIYLISGQEYLGY